MRSSIAGANGDRAEIGAQRALLQHLIASLPQQASADLAGGGRGIVMLVGGPYIPSAWVSLTLLREVHGCRLPIEVWYLDDDDLPEPARRLLGRFDVEFVDASRHPACFPEKLGPWELKLFAVLQSRFAEVLLLDADNVPLRDPSELFTWPEYLANGAVFWPDVRWSNPYSPIWSICDLDYRSEPEWESGQLVVDKRQAWSALWLAMRLSEASAFYREYVHGDKEIFHLAWRLLRASYAMPPTMPVTVRGTYDDSPTTKLQALIGLHQHDFRGEPLFLHRTDTKWAAWGRNPRAPAFALHDRCIAALDELERQWDGAVPPRAAAGLDDEPAPVAGERRFIYRRLGLEARRMTLLPDGQIGDGAHIHERYWREEEVDGTRRLVLSSRGDDTCRLQLEPDGIWRGRWIDYQQHTVELIPQGSVDDHPGSNVTAPQREPGKPKRLLYISPVIPADQGNGLAMRAASMLRDLCQRYRVSLLITPHYAPGASSALPGWVEAECEEIRIVSPPTVQTQDTEVANEALFTQEWIDAAGRAFRTERFDVIHIFRSRTYPLAERYLSGSRNTAAEWHIDLDDVESRSNQRLAALYRRYGLDSSAEEAGRQAVQAAAFEDYILRAWDRAYVCSETDRADLADRRKDARAELVVAPNIVGLPTCPPPPPRVSPLTLLFVGTFDYFPNVDAAIWLCREIVPVMREEGDAPFRILLVGTGAPREVRELAYIPEVEFIGQVPEMADWYARSDLVVVPLRAGGGTRIKVLEAMSFARPVVSTTIGAEGIDCVAGEHLLIADRANQFAHECLRLLHRPDLAARIAMTGRALVEQRYSRR